MRLQSSPIGRQPPSGFARKKTSRVFTCSGIRQDASSTSSSSPSASSPPSLRWPNAWGLMASTPRA
eukprot:9250411-Pyramimonas_sp.AAC.1